MVNDTTKDQKDFYQYWDSIRNGKPIFIKIKQTHKEATIIIMRMLFKVRLGSSWLAWDEFLDRVQYLYKDKNGHFWGRTKNPLSVSTIADRIGRSHKTVKQDLIKLQKFKVLKKAKRTPNGYYWDVRMFCGKEWDSLAYKKYPVSDEYIDGLMAEFNETKSLEKKLEILDKLGQYIMSNGKGNSK